MLKSLRRKIIGDLKANRGQFIAVWLVVMLGTTFYGAMYPTAVNMRDSLYRTYDQLNYMNFQVQADAIAPEVVNQVQAIPGVESVEGRLVIEGGLQTQPDQQYLTSLRLISVPDEGEPTVSQNDITNGHRIQADNEVLVLRTFAEKHDIKPGDSLQVWINGESHILQVAGLVFNAEYLIAGRSPTLPFPTPSTFGVAWMRYSDLATASGREGELNEIVLHLKGKTEAIKAGSAIEETVRQELTQIFGAYPDVAIYSRSQTASGGMIETNITGVFPMMTLFSGMFLLGSTLITSVMLTRMVESERQRIGTMRAMGITRHELVTHYLAFGLVIGITGGLIGSILGYLNSFWVIEAFLHFAAGGTLPGFVNKPQIPFILLGFFITLLGSVFAGMYPAWTLSATPPGVALRPAVPNAPNAISRLQLRFLPSPVRWAIRNILRVPGRSLSTAIGMIAGVIMIFSAFAMWDSIQTTYADYFGATTYDLRADINTLQPGNQLEDQIASVEGVVSVQAALIGPSTIKEKNGTLFNTIGISLDEHDPYFQLVTIEGANAFSRSDGVWIGSNTRRVLHLSVGDTITLVAFNQEHTVKVLGVVSYALSNPVFIPRDLLEEWAPGGIFPANTALVRVQPGQAGAVRNRLAGMPGLHAIEWSDEFERDMNFYLTFFRVGTLIFGAFGYILTLAVLFNTVNLSLRERSSELAVLQALGSTRREIALTVTLELLVMVLIGLVIGIPVGREVGFFSLHTYETDFFGTLTSMSLMWCFIGGASLVLIVLLSEIPGLRAVQRIDLGQVSKSQSF